MEDRNVTPKSGDQDTRFKDMSRRNKWIFVGKVVVCLVTFGFVFPNVL